MVKQILRTGVCCGLLCIGMTSLATANEDSRRTAVPSESPEKAIQRFVDECLAITPGEGPFPDTSVIGAENPTANELARQEIKFKHKFRVSKFEVTQELYQAVTGRNPSRWKGPRNSVENVSWHDAVGFCKRLTAILRDRKLIDADETVRLPTALEWEYCCRAGTETKYSFGDNVADNGNGTAILDVHAWHTGNAAGNDPAVGVLKPNPWGLYDVHGYLSEFVSDEQKSDDVRMIRGGSWKDAHPLLSSSTYLTVSDMAASDEIGFRCVICRESKPKIPR
jgi:formylglycine-generating enzyme required for sulfatase activity